MGINLTYEMISEQNIEQAVALVVAAYNEERTTLPILPEETDVKGLIHQSVTSLFHQGTGVVALLDGNLVAFMAGVERKELWGRCKGFYSPLFGHGAVKELRTVLYQQLYKHLADQLVKKQITSHALTLFANDKETIDTWFLLGFGNRCVDSIRQAALLFPNKESEIVIKKIDLANLVDLADIEREFHGYFRNAPMFMIAETVDPIEQLTKWLDGENHHLWAAYRDGIVVGHMQIEPIGETFVSQHQDVMNITGAYVAASERNSGIATLLLNTIQQWQVDHGYPLCGVDFEAFNIDGSRFWNRYFEPYTYTVTRRIDERINDENI